MFVLVVEGGARWTSVELLQPSPFNYGGWRSDTIHLSSPIEPEDHRRSLRVDLSGGEDIKEFPLFGCADRYVPEGRV